MINTIELLCLIKMSFGNRCLRAVVRYKVLSIMYTEKGIQTKMDQKGEKNVNILGKKVLHSLDYIKLIKILQMWRCF